MPTAELTLQSQAVAAYDGGDDLATSGALVSGWYDGVIINASAMRFALPSGFDGSESIASATLNLFILHFSDGYLKHRHRISILAASSQVLPSTGAGVRTATGGSDSKTIGVGTYSPALNYTVGTTAAWVAIDITDAMIAAQAASRLNGGHVVVLLQGLDADELTFGEYPDLLVYLDADGIGETNPATIDITYSDAEESSTLVLDEDLAAWTITAEAEVRSQIAAVDEPIAPWTLDAAAQTQNTASLSQTFPQWSLQALAASPILGQADLTVQPWTLDAVAQNGEGRQAALAADLDPWTITAEVMVGNPAVLDQSLAPWTLDAAAEVSIRTGDRSLFPARLFPHSLMT